MALLHIIYNKYTMQWCVKLGRITVFASDNYEIASDYMIQYQADDDSDRMLRQIKIIKENSFYGLTRKAGDINA